MNTLCYGFRDSKRYITAFVLGIRITDFQYAGFGLKQFANGIGRKIPLLGKVSRRIRLNFSSAVFPFFESLGCTPKFFDILI